MYDTEVDGIGLRFRLAESRSGYTVARMEARIRQFERHGDFEDVAENASCRKLS